LLVFSQSIKTVFGEAADRGAYYDFVPFMHEPKSIQKTNLTTENKSLNRLFSVVRALRSKSDRDLDKKLEKLYEEIKRDYPDEWLLRMELLEISTNAKLRERLQSDLL